MGAALRELRRGLVVQRGVQPAMVVVVAVLLAAHFGFQQGDEALPVQELVLKPAVEALAVRVLPRTAGRDVERLEPAIEDP
jgi:hypothetical protein